LLSGADLDYLFEKIAQHYTIAPDAEITLEANPDDLTTERLQTLRDSPVNRLSIGVQSFFEEDLTFMNRAHNAEEAVRCIKEAKAFGFDNMTVDLIYGSPTTSHAHWQKNIEQVLAFDIPHISCYCLTVEPNTALEHFVKKGKTEPVDEAHAAEQFEMLVAMLTAAGYEHYEISNFAKPDQHAKHNSNYWLGEQYLGVGPSAHSFDGTSRQWNFANNAQYLKALAADELPFEKEVLTVNDRYNEYILTALRTKWGVDIQKIASFGEVIHTQFATQIKAYLQANTVIENDGIYTLSTQGKLLADKIAMELFLED